MRHCSENKAGLSESLHTKQQGFQSLCLTLLPNQATVLSSRTPHDSFMGKLAFHPRFPDTEHSLVKVKPT